MKNSQESLAPEALSDDLVDLLLDEAERAMCEVDTRPDEAEARTLIHDADLPDAGPLRLALAELVDQHPGLPHELERLEDRLRTAGAEAAARMLELYPHVLDVVRLSLEVFVRQYPTAADYERGDARLLLRPTREEEGASSGDLHAAYLALREQLRRRLA